MAVHNPATEEVLASVPAGTAADVDRAVTAASPGWAERFAKRSRTSRTPSQDQAV
ncbi:aldehyde dehydrogenase family protein [Micromonospora aurantiaca]|uniref:aldehyde dehydrogenase family protein n=1 Tax=Micromonospora aurantiaca (nom. illeg.) TaxID=47850 RepID=UPI0033A7EB8B